MQFIVDNATDPREHLALDEAMLMSAEAGEFGESLRIWELPSYAAIAGRSTRVADEIDLAQCASNDMPVLRRCSGGASVVVGPGCLMYSVVLSLDGRADLRRIDVAHRHVMGCVLDAVRHQLEDAELQGTCDLTWQNQKCSGNSLRVARQHLLYHGTLLYDFQLPLIGSCLRLAPRQPEYRQGRDHDDFVTNVPIDAEVFGQRLQEIFQVEGHVDAEVHADRVSQLRVERYDKQEWHLRH